jgi:hypothetical protein
MRDVLARISKSKIKNYKSKIESDARRLSVALGAGVASESTCPSSDDYAATVASDG